MTRISNSELQAFKACRRAWYLGYYRRLTLAERPAYGHLSLGTRIHEALQVMYDQDDSRDPTKVMEEGIMKDLADWPEQEQGILKEADLARAMLEGYLAWVKETGADEGLTFISAEKQYEVPSGIEGVSLIEKLDARVRRESDGALLFMDHKTVGSLTDPVRMFPLNEQMLYYHLIEYLIQLHSGEEQERTDGAIYNMLRKVKRTAAAKPPFYERVEIRHNKEELRSIWMRVHGVIRDMLSVEQALDNGADHRDVAYPTPSRDCTWKCQFFPVCPMFDDGSHAEAMLERHYTPHDPMERYTKGDE